MGNCLSSTDQKEARDRSVAIDKQIEEDSRKFKKECKILLLGSGESGKSTIVKQMKIIHQNGYSKDELLLYRLTVIKNLVDSAQAIVLALRKFKMEPEMPENRENVDAILQYRVDADPGATLDHAMARKVDSLWKDPIIPATAFTRPHILFAILAYRCRHLISAKLSCLDANSLPVSAESALCGSILGSPASAAASTRSVIRSASSVDHPKLQPVVNHDDDRSKQHRSAHGSFQQTAPSRTPRRQQQQERQQQ